MSVTIEKLATRCRVSRRHEATGRLVDRVARGRLARELTELVGPAISSQEQIVRIRRLRVNLTFAGKEFDENAFATAWARALAKSLFEALAHAGATGPFQVVRAGSTGEFRAAFLRDLLAGHAGGRWEYAEFDELFRLPVAEAALQLLLSDPSSIAAALEALDGSPALEQLLARLDELALEKIFAAFAATEIGSMGAALLAADLSWVAAQALAALGLNGFALDSRRQALWIFVRTKGGDGRTPRAIFHALLALACLVECPEILYQSEIETPTGVEDIERRIGRRLPASVSKLLLELHHVLAGFWTNSARPPDQLLHLLVLLDRLRPLVPTAEPTAAAVQPLSKLLGEQAPWLELESAGLLLLTPIVIRLGWEKDRDNFFLFRFGGPRFFQILMAGIGSAVLDPALLEFQRLDPAVALFSGMELEPDLVAMRHSLAAVDSADRRKLLAQLVPDAGVCAAADDWPATFDVLAARLIGEFTSRVPGFRQASRGGDCSTVSSQARPRPDRRTLGLSPADFKPFSCGITHCRYGRPGPVGKLDGQSATRVPATGYLTFITHSPARGTVH